MAEAGEFPWHAESRLREPTYSDKSNDLDEKATLEAAEFPTSTNPQPYPPKGATASRRVTLVEPPVPTPTSKDRNVVREGAMHVPVRTIPPWVRDADESDLEEIDELPAALVAHHNYAPSTQRPLLGGPRQPKEHARLPAQPVSRWMSFARGSAYPRENFDSEIVSEKWLEENDADYSKPWLEGRYNEDDTEGDDNYKAFKKKQRVWYKRAQFIILRNPFIPLSFRCTIIAFALAALALGVSIYNETKDILQCSHQPTDSRSDFCISLIGTRPVNYYRDPSGLMAVIVDAIAVVYSGYITYDEYFSKPLGLRSARHKVRLILLDLFFIVFQSANLALSFSSLTVDEGACAVGAQPSTSVRFDNVCSRQEALSSVLLVSLVAWLMTFSVSVLRLVERINAR